MLKKIVLITSAVVAFGFSHIAAASRHMQVNSDDQGSKQPELYPAAFTLGITTSNELGLQNFLTWGYINNCFMFNFGANYGRFHTLHAKNSLFGFMGQLGLRTRLHQNLLITYGLSALSESKKAPKLGYAVGAFVGLDLQIVRHFLLSGKIDPLCFTRLPSGSKAYRAFQVGSLSLSYVF